MDISALASMKKVAKCDTWCELQNPVNHRFFKYKLCPKPLGRGHVCLGVTCRVAPRTPQGMARVRSCPPSLPERAAGLNVSPRRRMSRQVVFETQLSLVVSATAHREFGLPDPDCAYGQHQPRIARIGRGLFTTLSRRRQWPSRIALGLHTMVSRHRTWPARIIPVMCTSINRRRAWPSRIALRLHITASRRRVWLSRIDLCLHSTVNPCRAWPADIALDLCTSLSRR
uniref:Uncharacterized protein n=1 Tax=Solanum tuberosum TaxID=4113 RepID=M1DAM6_SOLTU